MVDKSDCMCEEGFVQQCDLEDTTPAVLMAAPAKPVEGFCASELEELTSLLEQIYEDDSDLRETDLRASVAFKNVLEHLLSKDAWVELLQPFMRGMLACCKPLCNFNTLGPKLRRDVLRVLSEIISTAESLNDYDDALSYYSDFTMDPQFEMYESPTQGKNTLQAYIAAHSEDTPQFILCAQSNQQDELDEAKWEKDKHEAKRQKQRETTLKRSITLSENRATVDAGQAVPTIYFMTFLMLIHLNPLPLFCSSRG